MINTTFYYYLENKAQGKAIGYHYADNMHKELPFFEPIDDQLVETLWMFKSAHLDNVYYITHCASGMVMETTKDKRIELHHPHDKPAQMFKIERSAADPHEVWIEEYSTPVNLLHYSDKLECGGLDPTNTQGRWTITRAVNNFNLVHSVVIGCEYSGYVLEVSEGGEKEGGGLAQSSWNGLFHQRWMLEKAKDFHILKNLKSYLIATIKGKKMREGNSIVQLTENGSHSNQLWSIEQRGYQLFSIRTAFDPELYLGTRDHALKEKAEIVLVKDEMKHLWRIKGDIP